MSLILQASGLSYRYPDQPASLFMGLELALYAGDHVALLGVNGSGKTTLLELLSGTLPLQTGQLTAHAEPLYVRQEDTLTGRQSVLDAVLKTYPDLGPLKAELVRLEAAGVPDPLRYAELLTDFAELGGYDLGGNFASRTRRTRLRPRAVRTPASLNFPAVNGGFCASPQPSPAPKHSICSTNRRTISTRALRRT